MFQNAIKKAMQFTLPVVVSYRREDGETGSLIATCIILNKAGWVLTAFHILEAMRSFEDEKKARITYDAEVAEISLDISLGKAERKKKLRSIDKPPENPVVNHSSWWGRDGWNIEQYYELQIADIAVAKIAEFDSSFITGYPVFKNPDVSFDPGINLCKLGFPFNSIKPEFDENTNRFIFPPGTLPMPLFPLEGMFTRTHHIVGKEGEPAVKFVETSSPGLMGQSGGPTFDSDGRIWAMQSKTMHYPLGFSPGQKNQEHQFLNAGMGTHAETLISFFDSIGVEYDLSAG